MDGGATRFTTRPGLRATILMDEEEQYQGRPLVSVLLDLARDAGVRTAFVSKGVAGFGERRLVHTTAIEILTFHLPLTVECVDEVERVERLVGRLGAMAFGGLLDVQPTALVVPE
ncbi:MAG TPA: DUF190 domain-containing protein [Thermodesulfobacteriota bacterium]